MEGAIFCFNKKAVLQVSLEDGMDMPWGVSFSVTPLGVNAKHMDTHWVWPPQDGAKGPVNVGLVLA